MAAEPFPTGGPPGRVFFERAEFTRILNLYGRMVAAGEWKDYAIDPLPDACVFSVFAEKMVQPIKASRTSGQFCRVNIAINPKCRFVLVGAACLASQNKHPNGAIFMTSSQLS